MSSHIYANAAALSHTQEALGHIGQAYNETLSNIDDTYQADCSGHGDEHQKLFLQQLKVKLFALLTCISEANSTCQ